MAKATTEDVKQELKLLEFDVKYHIKRLGAFVESHYGDYQTCSMQDVEVALDELLVSIQVALNDVNKEISDDI